MAPSEYKWLAEGSNKEYEEHSDHSAIAMPQSHAPFRFGRRISHMAEWSTELNQRIEAQDRLIQEQHKSIDEFKPMLMKVLGTTQRHTEDREEGSSSDKSKMDKQILDSNGEWEGGDEEFTIDPHAERWKSFKIRLKH